MKTKKRRERNKSDNSKIKFHKLLHIKQLYRPDLRDTQNPKAVFTHYQNKRRNI